MQETTWTPLVSGNLDTMTPSQFAAIVDTFEAQRKELGDNLPPIDLSNGWKTVTPQIAEAMLLRNKRNRKIALTTVRYYAAMMLAGIWKPSGQPILFDTKQNLIDAQHRLWAEYLSGASIPSYVIGDVPHDDSLFAYIDNSKPRNAADALYTSGNNGLSRAMAPVVTMANQYDQNAFTVTHVNSVPRMWPPQYIAYVESHEDLHTAAHKIAADYGNAAKAIGSKTVAIFAAFKIIEAWGEETCDRFMEEIAAIAADDSGVAPVIEVFWETLQKDRKKTKDRMKVHTLLGVLIKTFNAWMNDETPKNVTLRSPGTFPRFTMPTEPHNGSDEEQSDEGFSSTGPASDGLEYAARIREVDTEIAARDTP